MHARDGRNCEFRCASTCGFYFWNARSRNCQTIAKLPNNCQTIAKRAASLVLILIFAAARELGAFSGIYVPSQRSMHACYVAAEAPWLRFLQDFAECFPLNYFRKRSEVINRSRRIEYIILLLEASEQLPKLCWALCRSVRNALSKEK